MSERSSYTLEHSNNINKDFQLIPDVTSTSRKIDLSSKAQDALLWAKATLRTPRQLAQAGLVLLTLTSTGATFTNEVYAAPAGIERSATQETAEIEENVWTALPIVRTETETGGEIVLPDNLYKTINDDINLRPTPGTAGEPITQLDQGSVIQETEEERVEADGYTWINGNVLTNGEQVIEDSTINGYVYVDGVEHITDPSQVPAALMPKYQSSGELPISQDELSVEQLAQMANIGGGGENTTIENANTAWNIDPALQRSPELNALQNGMYQAAVETLLNTENRSGTYKMGDPREGQPGLTVYVNTEGNTVDIIIRMGETGDIFAVTRAQFNETAQDLENLNVQFSDVGFADANGLNKLYGEKASEIASKTTLLRNAGNLASEMSNLPQGKVLLPGLEKNKQFAPKLPPLEKKFRILYKGEGISPSETWKYQAVDNGYQAILTGQKIGTEGEIVLKSSIYMPDIAEQGEWANLPEGAVLETGVTRYANALGLTGQESEIMNRLQPRYITSNGVNLVEMYDPATGIPLFDGLKEPGKEIKYTVGMKSLALASGKHFGFSFPLGESGDAAKMIFEEGDSVTPLYFAHLNVSPSEDVLIDPGAKDIIEGWFKYAEQYGFRLTPGNYLSYAENYNPWLKNSGKTPDQMLEYNKLWNETMIKTFPKAAGWYFNEWLGEFNGTKLFNDAVFGGEMQPITSDDYRKMEELFINAQNAAKEVEKQTGVKPQIGLNDYVGKVTLGADGNYYHDNSVVGVKTELIFEVSKYLYDKGLLDKAGLQFGFDNNGAPSSEEIINCVKPFIDAGIPLEITEMRGPFTPEEWEMMIQTLLNTGVSSINIYRINGDRQLFNNNQPKESYYHVRKAFADYVFGQSQN